MPGSGLALNTSCSAGYDGLLPRKKWQMHLLRAGQIVCRLLEKHGKFDRDNVRRLTGVGGMTAVSRGLGPVSRETNGEASAGSAPQDSADGTEY